ncbi:MAG: phosphopantetheine-binding protein, partial [bacterium]
RDAALEELNDHIDVNKVYEILQEINYQDADLVQGTDHKKLVAYYTGSERVGTGVLREYLKALLTEAMIPSYFVHLSDIPLTANGKVDHNDLPDPRNERPKLDQACIPATTDTEKTLVKIWREALRINQVGIDDNFFDLGGDSIIAIQIVVRANEGKIAITPNQLFLHQTIRQLAATAIPHETETQVSSAEKERPFSLLDHDEETLKNLSSLLDA